MANGPLQVQYAGEADWTDSVPVHLPLMLPLPTLPQRNDRVIRTISQNAVWASRARPGGQFSRRAPVLTTFSILYVLRYTFFLQLYLGPGRTAGPSGVVPLSEGPDGEVGVGRHEERAFRSFYALLVGGRQEAFLFPVGV